MSNENDQAKDDVEQDLSFDLRLRTRPVTLIKEDGSEVKCTLRDIRGSQRVQYMNLMASRTKGDQGVKDFTGIESSLIAMMLWDENGKLVPAKDIEAYPSQVQSGLYNACMKLSGLLDEAQARKDAKNV